MFMQQLMSSEELLLQPLVPCKKLLSQPLELLELVKLLLNLCAHGVVTLISHLR